MFQFVNEINMQSAQLVYILICECNQYAISTASVDSNLLKVWPWTHIGALLGFKILAYEYKSNMFENLLLPVTFYD